MSIPDKLKEAIINEDWELVAEVYAVLTGEDIETSDSEDDLFDNDGIEKGKLNVVRVSKPKDTPTSDPISINPETCGLVTCDSSASLKRKNEKTKITRTKRPSPKMLTYICSRCGRSEETLISSGSSKYYICKKCY